MVAFGEADASSSDLASAHSMRTRICLLQATQEIGAEDVTAPPRRHGQLRLPRRARASDSDGRVHLESCWRRVLAARRPIVTLPLSQAQAYDWCVDYNTGSYAPSQTVNQLDGTSYPMDTGTEPCMVLEKSELYSQSVINP